MCSSKQPEPVRPGAAEHIELRYSWTISQLRYVFTPLMLNHAFRLKKSARFHVARHILGTDTLSILCGRPLPHGYYTTAVYAFSWPFMPVCPRCRAVAEKEFTGFGVIGE